MQRRRFAGLSGFCLFCLLVLAAPARAAERDEWQVLHIDGQRIGYSRSVVRETAVGGRAVVRTENETQMQIRRFNQPLTFRIVLRTEETPDGDLLAYALDMENPPAATTRTTGKVSGNRLQIETSIAGRVEKSEVELRPGVKSPAWQERVLRSQPLTPGQTVSFDAFLPEFQKIATVRIDADGYRQVKLHDGAQQQLLKLRATNSLLPTIATRLYADRSGHVLRSETDMLGTEIVSYVVPAEVALQELAGAELDIAVGTLVRVKRIPNPHGTRQVLYRVRLPDGDPQAILPEGPTQQVRRLSADTVELTVSRHSAIASLRRDAKAGPEYLAATPFLQINDARVREHAVRAQGTETDPVRIAHALEKYVHDKMEVKNFSTALASAAEVAKSLEGDCTEHAVLLAALLRVVRIPSRVVVGLVYSEGHQAFAGHMWTEAFLNGSWVPLDATIGRGGIGAAHIRLTESSLAEDGPAPVTAFVPLLNVLGRLQIEVLHAE